MPMMDNQRFCVVFIDWFSMAGEDMRLLILGGTSEARELARRVTTETSADVILSLAGRTSEPLKQTAPYRVGGFGGVDGLIDWLKNERIDAIVDATHPFAAQISKNVVEAARVCDLPVGSVVRAPWQRQPTDKWIEVSDAASAPRVLGEGRAHVFLTVGRLDLSKFCAAPQHKYLARTIDPPGKIPLPPDVRFVYGRGPFDVASEKELMRNHGIEVLVSKNSGGQMTYAKIEAARSLGLDVVMVQRPYKPAGVVLGDVEAAVSWIRDLCQHHAISTSDRDV